MASPLQDLLVPEARHFTWVEHEDTIALGPFTFAPDAPIPVAKPDNALARQPWLNVPYKARGPVPAGIEGDPADEGFDGEEVLRAVLGGHLGAGSRDYLELVDQVGRCLLIHATFGEDSPWHDEAVTIFASVEEGAPLFDLLLRRAKGHIDEGTHYTEVEKGDEALYEFLLARILLQGAHIVSPTTPGVLYDIGVLLFDLVQRLSFENEEDRKRWELSLSNESRYYLQLAMADKEIREETPAAYLLGVNREILGDLEEAASAYNRFMGSPAARLFPEIRAEVEMRLGKLPTQSGGDR